MTPALHTPDGYPEGGSWLAGTPRDAIKPKDYNPDCLRFCADVDPWGNDVAEFHYKAWWHDEDRGDMPVATMTVVRLEANDLDGADAIGEETYDVHKAFLRKLSDPDVLYITDIKVHPVFQGSHTTLHMIQKAVRVHGQGAVTVLIPRGATLKDTKWLRRYYMTMGRFLPIRRRGVSFLADAEYVEHCRWSKP